MNQTKHIAVLLAMQCRLLCDAVNKLHAQVACTIYSGMS